MTDLLSRCPTCGLEAPAGRDAPPGTPGGPDDDGWWEQARESVTEHPPARARPHVWLRRLVVAGHTAATIWLLFTHQVSIAEARWVRAAEPWVGAAAPWIRAATPWVGPAVAGVCALIVLFISATAIRGRWWPWLWAAAGWVAPVAATVRDTMWPVYVSVVVLPALALWLATRMGKVDVRVWLFEDFARAVAAPEDPKATFTLYRHFDADGRLLYVGKTIRPAWRRSREHARSKDWWPLVAWTSYTRYTSAEALDREEVAAIRRERPLHNVMHSSR